MKNKNAFSLIELSIVILVIGILIAGVTSGSKMVAKYQLLTAQNLTKNSPIAGIKDLAVWYETSLTSSFTSSQASDATAISAWLDNNPQSALKNDLTQGTAAAQPKFYENVFGVIPSVRFDGTDDFLNFDGTLVVNTNFTVCYVERKRSTASGAIFGGSTTGQFYSAFVSIWLSDTQMAYSNYDAGGVQYTSASLAYVAGSPVPRMFCNLFSQKVGKQLWVNGALVDTDYTTIGKTPVNTYPGSTIGKHAGSYFYNGDIAEIVVFTRDLKIDELQDVMKYLGKKFKITLS